MERARLEYQVAVAAACPDEAAVRSAVADRLGYDPFDPLASQLLRVRVTQSALRFAAVLELVDGAGKSRATRQLESAASCAELMSAVALSMSIAIDPEAAARSEERMDASTPAGVASGASPSSEAVEERAPAAEALAPVAAPKPAPKPQLVTTTSPPTPPRAARSRPRRFELEVAATGHLAAGLAPALAAGAGLSFGIHQRAWSLALEGRYDAPASSSVEPRGRVRTRFLGGALVPCFRSGLLAACGVGLAGSLEANASSVTAGRSDAGVFLAAGARVALSWRPAGSQVGLIAHGDVLLSLRPLEARLNSASVWSTSGVTGVMAAGVVAAF